MNQSYNSIMEESVLDEFIEEKGYILAHVIFEIAGKPKEHVEKAMKMTIERIDENQNIIFVEKEFGEPEQNDEGIWSAFIDTEILFKGIGDINHVVTNYLPSTINILEPELIEIRQEIATEFFSDLMSHLHQVNTERVQYIQKSNQLQKNAHAILRNAILLRLDNGPLKPKEIGKPLGINSENIIPSLQAMIKEGKLVKENDTYKKV